MGGSFTAGGQEFGSATVCKMQARGLHQVLPVSAER